MSKKVLIVITLVGVVIIGGGIYWKTLQLQRPTVPIPSPNAAITDKNTVAYNWQWEQFATKSKTSTPETDETKGNPKTPVDEVPYDVVRIYEMLQEVRLDDNGNVVVDVNAKSALEKAFSELGPDIGSYGLSQLQELIQIGLPGIAGQQTAEVMGNYYNYRLAETDLLAQQQSNPDLVNDNYEQLVQLRRAYMGQEVADKLFVEEELQARHMLASMSLLSNPNLSDEEKQRQQQQLQEKLNQQLTSKGLIDPEQVLQEKVSVLRQQGADESEIFNLRAKTLGVEQARALAEVDREQQQWQSRYNTYQQAKQQILQAGLSEADQQLQLEQLASQHFNENELERLKESDIRYAE